MLSNSSSAIVKRRQSHRRQNSTPVAFETPSIRPLPATIQNQRASGHGHRRGMSLDQRSTFPGRSQDPFDDQGPPTKPLSQDDMSVSITTNPGQPPPQHPIQQEAQQQRPAQPGHNGPEELDSQTQAAQTEQFQLIQPLPQTPQPPLEPLDASVGHASSQDQQQLSPALHLSPTSLQAPFQPGASPGPSEEALQNLKHHIEQVYGAYGATVQVNILPSPVAAPQKAGSDNMDIAPLANLNDLTGISLDPPTGGFSMTPGPSSDHSCYSPPHFNRSPTGSPRQRRVQTFLEDVEEIPMEAPIPQLGFSDAAPLLSSPMMHQHSQSSFMSSSPMHSPMRSPRAMSIADLNLDGSIEETGISADEIAAYISPQDPMTHRWTCLFPECNKTFGRRENIRSHVQTHLGDRQYRCNHCQKCFVRQHDLKRHSKIHTGDKPYRCPCGGGFARQDALTRHRQRGMCVGGFPGAVRSTARRGRPRKKRPEMDDRVEKANRTRRNIAQRNYADSISGGSISDDSEMSPIQDFNAFDSAPLADLSSDPPSDPFYLDNPSSPLPSTPPTNHRSFDATSPVVRHISTKKATGTAHPFDFDTQAGAQDPTAIFDFEREKADVDALFNLSGAADRFAQTPPHSPATKMPGSGASSSQGLPSAPKSPSHRSANSAVSSHSNAFTTPPTSPVTGPGDGAGKGAEEDATDAFCDFSASAMSTSGFEMSGLASTSMDMGMSMFGMAGEGVAYSGEEMINASMAWIDAHF